MQATWQACTFAQSAHSYKVAQSCGVQLYKYNSQEKYLVPKYKYSQIVADFKTINDASTKKTQREYLLIKCDHFTLILAIALL